jgi:dTMP kinase
VKGRLFVFEGPDGVGKSTIVTLVAAELRRVNKSPVTVLAFPGREDQSLGKHVYALHHSPATFGVSDIAPASLQLLHIAAHIDAIERSIAPRLQRGEIVLLDRYWWSTWVYGLESGADQTVLKSMIQVELSTWGAIVPAAIFLISRKSSLRESLDHAVFHRLSAGYSRLAETESTKSQVCFVSNDGTLDKPVAEIIASVEALLVA